MTWLLLYVVLALLASVFFGSLARAGSQADERSARALREWLKAGGR